MPEIIPTLEQNAVVDAVRNGQRSILVDALAGSAKTTTLTMAAHKQRVITTLCVAFNKRIVEEMVIRMPSYVQCATLNSVGHKSWMQHTGKRFKVDQDKVYNTISSFFAQLRKEEKEILGDGFTSMLRAVKLAKSMGYVPDKYKTMGKGLCEKEDFEIAVIEDSDIEPDKLFWKIVYETLDLGIAQSYEGLIDFDDQLYMSTLFGGRFTQYEMTMIDEAQDLSPLNHAMIAKMKGDRILAVGDPRQAIYAFRGAHTRSMEMMQKQFDMETFSLTTSFRCPKAVVRRAQQIRVPHMRWPDWAEEGQVTTLHHWDPQTPPDGSAVICRNNAPLFKVAMQFIKHQRGVRIVGNDIGKTLVNRLKKMGELDDKSAVVIENINAWRDEELAKASPSRHASITDRAECLLVFAELGRTLKESIAYAEHLFKSVGPVQFMTGHKAKGLEFDDVFYLDPFLIPSKSSKAQADHGNMAPLEQERNLDYVITTRAKRNLFFVKTEELIS